MPLSAVKQSDNTRGIQAESCRPQKVPVPVHARQEHPRAAPKIRQTREHRRVRLGVSRFNNSNKNWARPSRFDWHKHCAERSSRLPALLNSSFTLLKRSRGLNGFDKHTVTPAFANSTCSSANPCARQQHHRKDSASPGSLCSFRASSRPDIPGIWKSGITSSIGCAAARFHSLLAAAFAVCSSR